MIRCTKCQTINPDDAVFCSGCSSFLEWTGERISAEEAEAAAKGTVAAAESPVEAETPPSTAAEPEALAEAEAPAGTRAPAEAGAGVVPASGKAPPEPAVEVVPAGEEKAPSAAAAAPVAKPARPPVKRRVVPEPEPAVPAPEPAVPAPEPAVPAPEQAAPASPPEQAPTRPPEPATPSSAAPPSAAVPEPVAEPQPAAPSRAEEPPARRPTAPPPTPERRRPRPAPVAQPPVAPPEEPATPPEQPAARRPVIMPAEPPRPRPQPAPASRPVPEARPGDLICAVCGTPNEPSRRFCRRCGSSLAAAVVAVRQPWYRRIFARQRRVTAAGERPRRMGEAGQPRPSPLGQIAPLLIIAVAAGAVVGYLFVPPLHQRVDGLVADLRLTYLPEISDLHPPEASGAGVDGHTGDLAVDDNTATYWLANPSAGTPTLLVELGGPTNLGGLIFHSGSATDSSFTKHRRPQTVELSFPGTDVPAIELNLEDQSEPQATTLDVRDVESVEIRIVAWFAAGEGGDQLVALREVEFKERR